MTDIARFVSEESFADGISDTGQVVGEAHNVFDSRRAMLGSGETRCDLFEMTALPPHWRLFSARSINAANQIVVNGFSGSQTHAFVLIPNG